MVGVLHQELFNCAKKRWYCSTLVVDGRSSSSIGVDMQELINIFTRYNAYNAANLDGGGSSILYENGKIINNVSTLRYLLLLG